MTNPIVTPEVVLCKCCGMHHPELTPEQHAAASMAVISISPEYSADFRRKLNAKAAMRKNSDALGEG